MLMTVRIDAAMRAAYAKVGVPLWVPPSEVEHYLCCHNWSEPIALELCEWFARIWSMAYVAGLRGATAARIEELTVARMLRKMGYASTRVRELTTLLTEGLPLLYAKGQSHRSSWERNGASSTDADTGNRGPRAALKQLISEPR